MARVNASGSPLRGPKKTSKKVAYIQDLVHFQQTLKVLVLVKI